MIRVHLFYRGIFYICCASIPINFRLSRKTDQTNRDLENNPLHRKWLFQPVNKAAAAADAGKTPATVALGREDYSGSVMAEINNLNVDTLSFGRVQPFLYNIVVKFRSSTFSFYITNQPTSNTLPDYLLVS